jgi:hypothetical protein
MRQWEDESLAAIRDHERAGGPCESRPRSPSPPAQPADVFTGIKLHLADDIGTSYRWSGSALGGTGTERRATWTFTPPAPASAQSFEVSVDAGYS